MILMIVLRCDVKRKQQELLSSEQQLQLVTLGRTLAHSRIARKMPQSEAAVRANLSRNTVSRIENGDAGVAIGQILRYLSVIRPGATLADVLTQKDNVVEAQEAASRPRRARLLSHQELEKYDF
ncbi:MULTISPECIES: helix-turn-helix domain-containing protein [Serratia]|uniref:helix-turn-helix domain-containing protein n=1 Tax=Serratia TaxID=613 RepID=UPI002167BD69|nr:MULTISPECIES: helix-turn-helix transcriptional regulator [Serratia]MCS4267246.1 transcriptional regulator with XRE-family HTH domain [Serratia sp. BIGb0163]